MTSEWTKWRINWWICHLGLMNGSYFCLAGLFPPFFRTFLGRQRVKACSHPSSSPLPLIGCHITMEISPDSHWFYSCADVSWRWEALKMYVMFSSCSRRRMMEEFSFGCHLRPEWVCWLQPWPWTDGHTHKQTHTVINNAVHLDVHLINYSQKILSRC